MSKLHDHKSAEKGGKTTEVRMGREVPIIKKASGGDAAKDTECKDKKEQLREDQASSLV